MKSYELTRGEILKAHREDTTKCCENLIYAAQKKLLEWLDKQVLYTDDNEIGTGDDKNIMICLSPKQWQSLLRDFGIKDG